MKYIIEELEGQWTAHCDKYPAGACHSDFHKTPAKALKALINIDIPDWIEFCDSRPELHRFTKIDTNVGNTDV